MPSRCVLIVIDFQLDFYSRNSSISSAFPNMAKSISSLVEFARSQPDFEVVHLREGSNEDDSPWYSFWKKMNPGKSSSADATIEAAEVAAKEINGEKVFVKFGYDGTGVDSGMVSYLDSLSSDTKPMIFVCGLVTSCCVHCNAAGLFLRGYPTFVVADACGDRTVAMHTQHLERESRRCFAVVESCNIFESNTSVDALIASSWPNFTQTEK